MMFSKLTNDTYDSEGPICLAQKVHELRACLEVLAYGIRSAHRTTLDLSQLAEKQLAIC